MKMNRAVSAASQVLRRLRETDQKRTLSATRMTRRGNKMYHRNGENCRTHLIEAALPPVKGSWHNPPHYWRRVVLVGGHLGAQLGASTNELPYHHDFVGDDDRLQFDRVYEISLR
ncbi:hypothetical protein [Rhizobium sp. S163]|uniref:hypothetical protein n=1 Tax=Rhizobium sp. S163 TaxID=3055039 RepID=UPI0025A9C1DD|nr:hypothetical protein [Rhizobium sp. S163]MDM9649089.1 hypothetical protein [Rhizobium sp. S163]